MDRKQSCANCWAEAIAALLTTSFYLEFKDEINKSPQVTEVLRRIKEDKDLFSPQQLMDWVYAVFKEESFNPCNGATVDEIKKLINTMINEGYKFNLISDYTMSYFVSNLSRIFPFGMNAESCRNTHRSLFGVNFKPDTYLNYKTHDSVQSLYNALNEFGPMAVNVKIPIDFWYIQDHLTNEDLIITDKDCDYKYSKKDDDTNHVVLLYGYRYNNGNPYWLVRDTVSVLGYGISKRRYSAVEHIENLHGTCGIRYDVISLKKDKVK